MSKIAIGLPAFNESKNIASIIAQLKKKYSLIIVCDDGSSDLTSEISEEMGAIVVRHKTNLGYGAAIRSLFLKASELNCDILVTFDSDGQHKISDIENVIKPIQNKEANIVIGSRFLGNVEGNLPRYRKLGIKAITNLVNLSAENKITDSQSGFRGYDKIILDQIIPSDSGMGVSTEILIKANKLNLKIVEIPITILYDQEISSQQITEDASALITGTTNEGLDFVNELQTNPYLELIDEDGIYVDYRLLTQYIDWVIQTPNLVELDNGGVIPPEQLTKYYKTPEQSTIVDTPIDVVEKEKKELIADVLDKNSEITNPGGGGYKYEDGQSGSDGSGGYDGYSGNGGGGGFNSENNYRNRREYR